MLFAAVRRMVALQTRVRERGFDQRLAVVEGAIDLERADVVAPAGELVLLARRRPGLSGTARRRECRGAPMKRCRNGAAGVARGGDEDRERARIAGACERALHERRQKARADVLESGGRPVKQLEHGQLGAVGEQRLQR